MNQFQEVIQRLLPSKHKQTPSGWISFNAVCCHHKGENPDRKQRGGILFTNDGWNYHCFNCGYKAGWTPGHNITKNTKLLLQWLGLNEIDIGKLNLFVLKSKDQKQLPNIKLHNFELETRSLPADSIHIEEFIKTQDPEPDLVKVIEYIYNRGQELSWYPFHWSSSPGYRDRLLIPFYERGKIVGWTGRKITQGKPKYLSDSQPGYVFNIDRQTFDKRFCIVVEGQLDAIAVDAVSIMTNEVNETQAARINSLNKPVIAVPDRDQSGRKLIDQAIKLNWSVSLPPWEPHIKDVADAVKYYGRCYTLYSIIHYQESNPIKLQILSKQLKNV